MRALILAAGRGSRMKQMTDERPKCLVELNGRSLLDHQLASLRAAGIDEIGIVTGYRREMLSDKGLIEFHNPRWQETNMVSSLACAAQWLEAGSCVVSYSDIFYEPEAVSLLTETSAELAVTYDPNWLGLWSRRFGDPLDDAETFRMDDKGFLLEIGNRPTHVDEVQGQYMGLLRFTPTAWAEITRIRAALGAAERDRMHMTGTLQRVIEAGRMAVKTVAYGGSWGEIDSASDLDIYSAAS